MKVCTLLVSASLLFASAAPAAAAEDFPTKTVRLVVPSPAGSALDGFGRALAKELTARWKQTVFVESKAGAGGTIAVTSMMNEKPDGYTLFLPNEQILVNNRFVFGQLPYDPDKSFTYITQVVHADQMIAATADVPFEDFAGFLAYAKANPDALNYGMWSPGSSPNLALETLKRDAGINLTAIPYRGVGPVMLAMTSGEVQLTVMSAPTGAPLFDSGKAIPLAATSPVRSPLHPNVPTTAELGYPHVVAGTWYGLVGPAGMSPELVDKIYRDVRDIVTQPDFFERYPAFKGWNAIAGTPAEMIEAVKKQVPVTQEMMKTAGVEPQ